MNVLLASVEGLIKKIIIWMIVVLIKFSWFFKMRFETCQGLGIIKTIVSTREHMSVIQRRNYWWNKWRLDVSLRWDTSITIHVLMLLGSCLILLIYVCTRGWLLFILHFFVDSTNKLILIVEVLSNILNLLSKFDCHLKNNMFIVFRVLIVDTWVIRK